MRLVLTAAIVALLVGLLGTPLLIRLLKRRGYSQAIRDVSEGNFPDHGSKRGTPSMGGITMVLGVLLGYAVAHLYTRTPPTASALLVLLLMTGMAFVGFCDDYIKIFKQRSLGLRASTKFGGQTLVAVAFAVLALRFPNADGVTPASDSISFVRDTGLELTAVGFVLWAVLLIAGTTNAVNLTDGLDGLATGAAVMVFGSYVLIGVWQVGQSCASADPAANCYVVRDPLDLAVVAAAFMGACFGFLWWNASPAKIFMGDTGSLSIGGTLAGLAVFTRTELLLALLGGLFVLITLSVIIQVGSFKLTGRRVFRMAPLQHHFELVGWGEVTIVIRFWIIAGLCAALGLATFYAEWLGGL
ncbi:phospho-N-acetylmuramoyl-pentapeptide-transferase [Vallicoccus soli]|uniref:Phospho-N-acetylmuramoyl-pentapeptide-transferase n=1 Tax=Vallicoccus soli TaxID=2339232 RepID=A0A3A3ZL54_9ACTN|nr:phospho-N-acetylmuramoyl-pentapeptide-transferase [Vallicoccus soli]RJK96822.1 phospho-N-acetylmuramoyl-pentapeptide-transferase [Vallicoccus soli]